MTTSVTSGLSYAVLLMQLAVNIDKSWANHHPSATFKNLVNRVKIDSRKSFPCVYKARFKQVKLGRGLHITVCNKAMPYHIRDELGSSMLIGMGFKKM